MKIARINLNVLKAASTFASTEAARSYLNGVYVEFHPDHELYVGCDGHRLFVYRDKHEGGIPTENARAAEAQLPMTGAMIIPASACAPFKLSPRQLCDFPYGTLEGSGKLDTHVFHRGGGGRRFDPIDGTFPDFRRVLPGPRTAFDKPSDVVSFNWSYMAAFAKAGKALDIGEHPALIQQSANGPAWVTWGIDHVFGVIMPIRSVCDTYEAPAWLSAKPDEACAA